MPIKVQESEDEADKPCFKDATIEELLRISWRSDLRITPPALRMSSEILRLFAQEAFHRATEQAKMEQEQQGKSADLVVDVQHISKIAPGLANDF